MTQAARSAFIPRTTLRREFLARAGAAGGALALARPLAAAAPSQPKKIRVGIVGGRFGLGFQFHEHPDCVVEAVSDLRPERRERLQRVYRCQKAFDSLDELLRDPKVEAVALFTPMPTTRGTCSLAWRRASMFCAPCRRR